jgi:hypothetical protein
VVRGLLWRELAHGREHTKGVAREHDDVARLRVDRAGHTRAGDELDRVRAARVLRDRHIVIVRDAVLGVVHDVLEDRAKADRVEDLGLLLGREVDALGVAAALDVKHTRVGPDMLVVADQRTVRVGGECRLARAGETEEEGDVTGLDADVGGRVQGELAELDRLEVMLFSRKW